MIEVRDKNIINSLKPNLNEIVTWGKKNSINGCFIFTNTEGNYFYGRNFNHLPGNQEDSATGVAAIAIAAIKQIDIILFQGEYSNNPCCLNAGIMPDGLWLEGYVAPETPDSSCISR